MILIRREYKGWLYTKYAWFWECQRCRMWSLHLTQPEALKGALQHCKEFNP